MNFPIDSTRNDYYIQLFEGLFPKELLEIIIDKVNKEIEGEKLSYGEFLQWIGVWILISTVDGTDHCSFLSTKAVDPFEGAPFHVTLFISCHHFENILINLGYTKNAPPPFCDCFLEVREMLSLWNKNMGTQFSSTSINCINESMSKWVNEYTCPGFMYVPCKQWPFGNEYHDAGCADSDIIWAIDLRERKDRPANLGNKEFDEHAKTCGILL